MRRKEAARSVLATASKEKTIDGKTIYATDLGAARPLSARYRAHAARNPRTISVGHSEETPFGTLTCKVEGNDVVVSMRKGRKPVGRKLVLRGAAALGDRPIPESDFSVELDEFIGTPWHELEYTSVWTVHGLRTKGKAEAFVDH